MVMETNPLVRSLRRFAHGDVEVKLWLSAYPLAPEVIRVGRGRLTPHGVTDGVAEYVIGEVIDDCIFRVPLDAIRHFVAESSMVHFGLFDAVTIEVHDRRGEGSSTES